MIRLVLDLFSFLNVTKFVADIGVYVQLRNTLSLLIAWFILGALLGSFSLLLSPHLDHSCVMRTHASGDGSALNDTFTIM